MPGDDPFDRSNDVLFQERCELFSREDAILLIRKIDGHLYVSKDVQYPVPEPVNFLPESSLDLLGGDLKPSLRLGIDEVNNGLRLGQIDSAIDKGPEGEFSRFCEPCTLTENDLENLVKEEIAAMGIDFDHILSSIRMRGFHPREEDLIDHPS
jgi:hypothetical protein